MHVSTTVKNITKFGAGFQYHTLCDRCDRAESIVISRETHDASTAYLKQIAQNQKVRDQIVKPVSADELALAVWANDLQDNEKVAKEISAWRN